MPFVRQSAVCFSVFLFSGIYSCSHPPCRLSVCRCPPALAAPLSASSRRSSNAQPEANQRRGNLRLAPFAFPVHPFHSVCFFSPSLPLCQSHVPRTRCCPLFAFSFCSLARLQGSAAHFAWSYGLVLVPETSSTALLHSHTHTHPFSFLQAQIPVARRSEWGGRI
ncbi:hypothetical protein IWZ01DRAFT_255522 [Phyllosticta capitalensis]